MEWRKLGKRWDLGAAWIMGQAGEEEDGSKNNSHFDFLNPGAIFFISLPLPRVSHTLSHSVLSYSCNVGTFVLIFQEGEK